MKNKHKMKMIALNYKPTQRLNPSVKLFSLANFIINFIFHRLKSKIKL